MGKHITGKRRVPRTPLANLRWENFCKSYIASDFRLNGTQCYIKNFYLDIGQKGVYNTARSRAARLLTNVHIRTRIKELLADAGFNDINIEKQHTFLINQCVDLKVKVKGIELYYKLKGKLAKRQEYTLKGISEVLNEIEAEKKLWKNKQIKA